MQVMKEPLFMANQEIQETFTDVEFPQEFMHGNNFKKNTQT